MLMRSGLRLVFIALGVCTYTGLAILGWGGFQPFFSHAALTVVVVVLFGLSILSFFAGGNLNAGVREDRGNRWVLPVFGVVGFLNAYLPAYTDRQDLWTIDGDTIRWPGDAEENLLHSQFGDEYNLYRSHTWRLIPGIY